MGDAKNVLMMVEIRRLLGIPGSMVSVDDFRSGSIGMGVCLDFMCLLNFPYYPPDILIQEEQCLHATFFFSGSSVK